ncbi:MAG: hypothetical protein IPN54_01610 [Bacteroidetes bacterium]|nr:hypothetical protein [Bacteroidota bacterium]
MALIEDLTIENLKEFGIQGLSYTMPVSTQKWSNVADDDGAIEFDQATLSLNNDNNWLAPFSGVVNTVNNSDKKLVFSLQKADGSMVNEAGAVLRLFPQQILRMKRLIALKFETANTHTFEQANGNVLRQVPAFIFYSSDAAAGISGGYINVGEDLGFSGSMSFFDEQGHILHPLYVASLVKSLIGLYPILDIDSDNSLNNQLSNIIELIANSNTVRLVQSDGSPYDGTHVQGITAVNAGIGLFSINAYTGSDTSLKGELTREAATAVDGSFPPLKAAQFFMGNVCYGRMLQTVPLPALPTSLGANTLSHDFFTIQVVESEKYLLGDPNDEFNGTKLEPKPFIRLHQNISTLPTGNHLMGRLQTIFSGTLTEALCVGTGIDNTLPLPANDTTALWPQFPGIGSATPDNSFPANLKNELQTHCRADFIIPGSGQATDVRLRLTGIPVGAAIRVYNRVFGNDAIVSRGDGAGGVCTRSVSPFDGRTLNGEIDLILIDPLGLRRPDGTVTVPTDPKLFFDLMINLNNGTGKRLFGALMLPIQAPISFATPTTSNVLQPLTKKGISNTPIIGLNHTTISSFDVSSFKNFLNSILTLSGETQPRDAPRHPTMARRDLLAASLKTGNWEALIGGGPIHAQIHNASQDNGCPGGPGGKETINVGIYTEQGQLAYDIGRMAFRRCLNFYERIVQLANANWNEPAAAVPLSETDAPSASVGTFNGALLQNIAAYSETPELALIKTVVDNNINSIPENFDSLVDQVVERINNIDTGSLPGLLNTAVTRLRTELVTALNNLKDNNTLSESDKERLYNELKRELSAACYGRRDTQWSIKEAIKNARNFIYIETPGFSFTKGTNDTDYAVDLIQDLNTQLSAKPGLKVILCVPRKPDFAKQYDQWIKSEVKERLTIINNLPVRQVVAFHPIGFPGRASNLEQTVMIVDDVWALVGSSSFRRRGLAFDGSSDIVFTDNQRSNGIAPAIKDLRLSLLKQRLGIAASDTTSSRALQLQNIQSTFGMIRQQLVAGGLGKIERLFNGHEAGIPFSEPTIDKYLANPDGLEFNTLEATVYTAFTGLAL